MCCEMLRKLSVYGELLVAACSIKPIAACSIKSTRIYMNPNKIDNSFDRENHLPNFTFPLHLLA